MRENMIDWRDEKYEGDKYVKFVCPNFLMACKFEGFDQEEVEKLLTPLIGLPDNPEKIHTILKVIPRKRDDFRLVIWSCGKAKMIGPTDPCWVYMDEGRNVLSFNYGRSLYIFEDEKAGLDKAKAVRAILVEHNLRRDYDLKLKNIVAGNIWMLDFNSVDEIMEKDVEKLREQAKVADKRKYGEGHDENEVAKEERTDNDEFEKGIAECNYDYGKAIDESKKEIANKYGRGRMKLDGMRMRYKNGRMYNCKTAEYLILPHMNFGPDAWWQARVGQYHYRRDGSFKTRPQDVIKHLANLWKDNVNGAYQNKNTIRNYDSWLDTKPKLKMGILNRKNILIEKTLTLERRTVNPKTGEEYTHVHYCMNGFRVPKARWDTALKHWTNPDIPDWEFNGFLKQMGKYTVEMLDLPNTIKTVAFNVPSFTRGGDTERFDIKFNHRLNEGYWNVYCKDLMSGKMKADHETVRKFLGKLRNSYNNMAEIVKAFGDVKVTEDDFMQALQVRVYRRAMKERKSEDLLNDVAAQFPEQIQYFKKERYLIVKGKIRNYKVNIDETDSHGQVKVHTAEYNEETKNWDEKQWVCAFEDSRTDTGIAYDKVVTRTLMLMNDEEEEAKKNMNIH